MSDFAELRDDMAGLARALDGYSATAIRNLLEQSRQIDKLWTDNAELRDEIHAVANRVERLTQTVGAALGEADRIVASRRADADPAEVAAAIVNDANRSTLREVRGEESS